MIHKTTRSILSVLLAALLLVTSVPLTPAFADGGGVSLQSARGESGKLTQDGDDTYLIYTAENLKEFADIVNGTHAEGINQNTSANAKLMNDIDLSSVCSEENGTWTPIGNSSSNSYRGTFNGAGHTISGLYIDSNVDCQGLFGYVGSSGKIEKLSVSGSVSGNRYVGGVVGLNSGIVENCYNIGKVSGNRYVGGVVGYNGTGATVSNCYNTGTITGTDDYVVGVVGYNRGTVKNCHNIGEVSGNRYVGGVVGSNNNGRVENCHNTGSVTGTDDYVGGVVGYNYGSVTNCYNTGSVSGPGNQVGGVVGYNISSVTNCYNTGSVSGTGNQVGGVVGYNDGGRVGGRVENCYNTGEVSGNSYVGGVVGDNSSSGNVTGCYFLQQDPVIPGIGGGYTDRQTAEPVDNLDALCENFKSVTGWETNTILKRPVLKDNHEDDGSEQHPYEIFTAAQLENFRDIVNGPDGNPAAHAVLMENITLNSSEEWTPIGTSSLYSGTFDGNGKTINIYTTADYQGLFGYVYGGTVKNLNVSGTVSNVGAVGGIVNVNSGRVENCTFSGSVKGSGVFVGGVVGNNGGTVTGCIFSGSGSVTGVTGSSYVGGVVGENSGSVINCYNTGSVTGVIGVTGSSNYVGGVVGNNEASVTNCYNTGSVSGPDSGFFNAVGGVVGLNSSGDSSASASVTNCYNTGKVTGSADSSDVGGVVGLNSSASVANCYYQTGKGAAVGIGGTTGDNSSQTAVKSLKDFQSGEVAWLLQSKQTDESGLVWGQTLGGEEDSLPTLVALDKNAKTVYQVTLKYDHAGAQDKTYYTNDTATPSETPSRKGYTFDSWQKTTGEGNTITYTAKWTPHTYSITASPSALDFGSITEGEERPAAQTVTVKNTGNQSVTLVQPTANNFEITTSDSLTLATGETATFTVQPKDKLPRGSYSEQIAISNTNGEKATITASFTVKEPPYTGKYSYEVSTSVGDHGSLTVDRYATEGEKVTITVTPDEAYKLDDLSVTANGKDVELTANGDGTFSFTMPSTDVKITATFAEDPDWTEPEPEPTTDVSDIFVDVAPNAWYKDAIQYAYDNGLMTGVSATEFAPEATTTRAMIVSILARLENVTTAQAAGFADVNDEWYATAVNWAANVGVVNGYEDNTFKPNTAITREQLAAILMNYAAYKGEDVSNRASLATYTDQPSTWAEEAMSWAVAEGLISGVTADTLQPQGAATRAQVAAILQRFLSE